MQMVFIKWHFLSYYFCGGIGKNILIKKDNPYKKDSATGKNKYIIIKSIIYIII